MKTIKISNQSPWTTLALIDDQDGCKLYGERDQCTNALRTLLSKHFVYAWQRDGVILYHPKGDPINRQVLIDGFEIALKPGEYKILKDDLIAILRALESAWFEVNWNYEGNSLLK